MDIFSAMRMTRVTILAVAGLLAGAISVSAVNRSVKPADFGSIEKRNPFGLTDPPPPTPVVKPVEPVEEEPPPNVELTGMYHDSVKNKTFALFLVQVPGEPKKRSYILPEGERREGLEVEEINREKQNVKIKVKGRSTTITYNEPKAVAAPAVPKVPGAGGRRAPSSRVPSPRMQGNQSVGEGGPSTVSYSTSGRQSSFTGRGRSTTAVAGGLPQSTTPSASSLRSIPTRNVPQMTRQEQEVLIEANRAQREYQQAVNPGALPPMPPLPPTSITPPDVRQRITVQPRND